MTPVSQRFIYAPPVFDVKAAHTHRLPKPPFSGAAIWKCSVFYYWWEYLRCNDLYRQTCEEQGKGPLTGLYKDFGNVHAGPFKQWWKERGEYLFAEPPPRQSVRELKTGALYRSPEVAILQIPLTQPLHVSFEQVRDLLAPRIAAHKEGGIRQPAASQAMYPVVQRPNLAGLDLYLRAWKLKRRHELANRKMTLFELAMELDIVPPKGIPSSNARYRAIPTNEVARRLRIANRMIANVGKGLFPKYEKKVVYRLSFGG